MLENELERKPTDIYEAILRIEAVIGECSQMGANDSEIPELRDLVEQVRDRRIEPDKAIRKAESILASKQDYH